MALSIKLNVNTFIVYVQLLSHDTDTDSERQHTVDSWAAMCKQRGVC